MITAADVTEYLQLKTGVDSTMTRVVAAINAFVSRLPVAQRSTTSKPGDEGHPVWTADVSQGAVMLAATYYRRRNSPNGVEAITESGATYIARHDPQMSRLLGLDSFAKPRAR